MISINTVKATTSGHVEFISEAGNMQVRHTLPPDQAEMLAEQLKERAREARNIERLVLDTGLLLNVLPRVREPEDEPKGMISESEAKELNRKLARRPSARRHSAQMAKPGDRSVPEPDVPTS